jgi:pimeloyl-ACP methyl ester carboxylesterase
MPAYEHDGLRLAYSVVGAGPPVLFLHGATGTGAFDWGRIAAELSARYRCVLPDLRGHGDSDFRPQAAGGEAMVADLLALIGHLGLARPHIVGFSYGSEIALMLELAAPGTARSLALVSPGTGRSADYRMPSLAYLHRVWPHSLRHLHAARHGPEHWRVLVALLQQDSARRPELAPGVLARVGCPVLLLAGERDEPARRRQARRFAEVNPRAGYAQVKGAAHAAHLERPAEVTETLRDFLAEVDDLSAPTPAAAAAAAAAAATAELQVPASAHQLPAATHQES